MNASGNDGESEIDDGSVVVREEGVEVTKSHESERFPVPAIVFSVHSERDESVEVRLTDRVPDGVSIDDIGFHPEYGSEFWSVEGRTLVFDRDVEEGAEIETVYGLRGPDAEDADRFLGDPTIEVWTGGESDSSFVDDINDQLTRSATFADDSEDLTESSGDIGDDENGVGIAETEEMADVEATMEASENGEGSDVGDGDGDGDDYPDAGGVAAVEGGIETNGREGSEDGGSEQSDDGESGEDNAMAMTEDASMNENTPNDAEIHETSAADGTATDAIAAQLARELRTGDVDSEDREVLRDVLGPRESVSARIDHLRSQVNDVAAYADALEVFLDENGSGRTLIRQQTERLDALREDTETVTEQAGANSADVERIENDVDAFQAAISDLDEEIERIDERFASIDERFEESESRSEEITERLNALEASHESEMADLREEMETEIGERVASVERTTEDVETDVESLKAWRAQLAGVLGGTGSADASATESEKTETGSENGNQES